MIKYIIFSVIFLGIGFYAYTNYKSYPIYRAASPCHQVEQQKDELDIFFTHGKIFNGKKVKKRIKFLHRKKKKSESCAEHSSSNIILFREILWKL